MSFKTTRAEVDFSIKNLPSLKYLDFAISGTIDQAIVTLFVDQYLHIEELFLEGNLSYFNLDSLVNLRKLSLYGTLNESFNFELFENLCNQLEDIKLKFDNIEEKTVVKLFENYYFPCLVNFSLRFFNLTILKKEFLDRFPMLRNLSISQCKIVKIESDSFANLEHLCSLDLSHNRIRYLDGNTFSKLKNLEKLNLRNNKLRKFDPKCIGLREWAENTFIFERRL